MSSDGSVWYVGSFNLWCEILLLRCMWQIWIVFYVEGCGVSSRPTKRGEGRGGGVGGAGVTSPGPPNLFRAKGSHEAFKLIFIFTFLGCIFTLFLFLSLSIALFGPNE